MDITTALDTATAVVRAVDTSALPPTRAQRVQALADVRALRNMCDGLEVELTADLLADEDSRAPGPLTREGVDAEGVAVHGRIEEHHQTPELIAARLGMSVRQARSFCHTAMGLVQRAPALVGEMRDGRLDEFRAGAVHAELRDAPAEAEARVIAQLVAHAAGRGGWRESAGPLRRRARALLATVDADHCARRAEVEREFRTVFTQSESEFLDRWTLVLPVEDSRQLFAAVDELAHSYLAADRANPDLPASRVRWIDQARADALVALGLESVDLTIHLHAAIPAGRAAGATATAPAAAVAAAPTAPAAPAAAALAASAGARLAVDELPEMVRLTGFGSADTTPVSRAFVAAGMASGRIVIAEPLVCDETTGALVHGDIAAGFTASHRRPTDCTSTSGPTDRDDTDPRYRIPEAFARFVRFRDQACRFPGCTASARFCDLDHVIPWPRGWTSPGNLLAVCRRHHRLKQSPGWSVVLRPDATAEWTDPTGLVLVSEPPDLLCVLAAPEHLEPSGEETTPVSTLPTRHALEGLEVIAELAEADDNCRLRRRAGLPDSGRRSTPRLSAFERQLYDLLAC